MRVESLYPRGNENRGRAGWTSANRQIQTSAPFKVAWFDFQDGRMSRLIRYSYSHVIGLSMAIYEF